MNIFQAIGTVFNYVFMQPIYNGLMLLYFLFRDYGLAIVVLTVIVKLLLFPLTLKQLKSMKATQQLQPKMKEIREKYAKNPQAQAQAMQALYREYNINPLGGCLPLLVQLPVLYGLYYALSNVLNNPAHYTDWLYSFLQPLFSAPPDVNFNWLKWLSPVLTFSLAHPDPSHVLPVIAALATFVQIRMSQPLEEPPAPSASPLTKVWHYLKPRPQKPKSSSRSDKSDMPDPAATMKIMQYIMPAMTLIFALSFAAGLALYWTVSSIFQAVQQYFVLEEKHKEERKTKGTVVDSTARVIGSNGTDEIQKKQTKEISAGTDEKTNEESSVSARPSGAVASKLRTTSTPARSGDRSSSSPRPRTTSASARRRGGAQRSRR